MSSDQTYLDERKHEESENMKIVAKYVYDKIIFRWTHRHEADEKPWTYDADHISWCERCKENFQCALDEGKACPKHPEAYFEPAEPRRAAYCEMCNPEVIYK